MITTSLVIGLLNLSASLGSWIVTKEHIHNSKLSVGLTLALVIVAILNVYMKYYIPVAMLAICEITFWAFTARGIITLRKASIIGGVADTIIFGITGIILIVRQLVS